jgi:hypothetical protein
MNDTSKEWHLNVMAPIADAYKSPCGSLRHLEKLAAADVGTSDTRRRHDKAVI